MHSEFIINGKVFSWGVRTYIMGILNLTPDSFSGDGLFTGQDDPVEAALNQARQYVTAGVDIIDVGGESTRPGAQYVDEQEEVHRVVPVIQRLAAEFDIILSIDTYKAKVADAAISVGANMVNDVWGLNADPDLARVVAKWRTPIILMHNRSSWAHAEIKEHLGGRYVGVPYDNLINDIKSELLDSVRIAENAGIANEKIILDPGIGFGKTVEQNLELLNRLDEIRALGYPILIGPSRKSFIGYTLDVAPNDRLEGTAAAVAVGISRGADIVRVHDVSFMKRVACMTDAIVRRVQQ